ncbi:DNA oxidative demethylase AlkB [Candidatus Protochlamydia amoebophila]|nr:DNA oxidative demethylase AlkB [Candidatus Protochlamydia amoebophila]
MIMKEDLFENQRKDMILGQGAILFAGLAKKIDKSLLSSVQEITQLAPFRHMKTSGGFDLSAAMTNCGLLGWVTDEAGYRYQSFDPLSGLVWPKIPPLFLEIALEAAERAGYSSFVPSACLINRYVPGAKMSLHQDKDEDDLDSPIVSVSLGLPATFQFGGFNRTDPLQKLLLIHGDVVVWGGKLRLTYHGILPLKSGHHHLTGSTRINLTFRKVF